MRNETAAKMYESTPDRLLELLRQEKGAKDQISHWAPIVEQLAKLCGETVNPEVVNRINELSKMNGASAGMRWDLREAIRWVFRQPLMLPLTPTQVRDHLAEMGYDLESTPM